MFQLKITFYSDCIRSPPFVVTYAAKILLKIATIIYDTVANRTFGQLDSYKGSSESNLIRLICMSGR